MHSFHPVLRLISVLVFYGGHAAATADTLHLNKVASYADSLRVRDEVQTECKPDTLLPDLMREEILSRTSIRSIVQMDDLSGKKAGLVMELSILDLQAPPGTSWNTAMRTLKVKSVLYRDGSIAGEYVRNAKTPGSGSVFTKIFKNSSSCEVIERLAREVAVQTVERFKILKLLPE